MDFWGNLSALMRRCNDELKDLVTWDWERILHWIAGANRESLRKAPMNVHLTPKTVDEYALYWQTVCGMLDENVGEIAAFKYTEDQLDVLEELRALYDVLDQDDGNALLEREHILDRFHSVYTAERLGCWDCSDVG